MCCCRSCPNFRNSTVTRVIYAVLLLLLSIAAWVMLNKGVSQKLHHMCKYSGGCKNAADDLCKDLNHTASDFTGNCDELWGELGASRVMFSGTVFFGLMSLLTCGAGSSQGSRGTIQNGLWGIKLLLLAGGAAGAFFIENSFFLKAFAIIGLIGGFSFLLIQLLLLIDFAHAWADSWVGKMEEGSNCHKWLMIVSALGMYIGSFIFTILMYVFYTKPNTAITDTNCGTNKFVITFNLLTSILLTMVGLSGRVQEVNPNSGLLQAGVVVSYTTYLTWSAVSENDLGCTPSSNLVSESFATIFGAMFTFVAVCYASLRTAPASSVGKIGLNTDAEDAEQSGLIDDDDGGESGGKIHDDEQDQSLYNWTYFHITFMLAALYLMEVLTDWSLISDDTSPDQHVGRGAASVWIKIVSGWISQALYIWTLVAPICLPDRDFS